MAYLIDDSGPALAGVPFPGGWSPSSDAWSRWNVQAVLGDICPECERDFSAIYSALERWYPNDRKSLLSHLFDPRIEWAYGLIPVWGEADAGADALYASALRRTASVLEASRWEWFYAPECGHTLVIPTIPTISAVPAMPAGLAVLAMPDVPAGGAVPSPSSPVASACNVSSSTRLTTIPRGAR